MKPTTKTLIAAMGLLAAPFGALAENAGTESNAARDAVWEHRLSGAETTANFAGIVSTMDRSGAARSGNAATTHIANPANAWADNFRAGLVHEPGGN